MDGQRRDVTIKAPSATMVVGSMPTNLPLPGHHLEPPSPLELLALQQQKIRELEQDVKDRKTAMNSFVRLTASLVKRLADAGVGVDACTAIVPRDDYDRMIGAAVTVSEVPDGDLVIRFRERYDMPFLGSED